MPQITQLDNDPTPNNNDLLVTVDMAAGTTKNISREQFFTGAPLPAGTLNSSIGGSNSFTLVTSNATNPTNFGSAITLNIKKGQILTIVSSVTGNPGTGKFSVGYSLSSGVTGSAPGFNDTAVSSTADVRTSFVTEYIASADGTVVIQPQYTKTSGNLYGKINASAHW